MTEAQKPRLRSRLAHKVLAKLPYLKIIHLKHSVYLDPSDRGARIIFINYLRNRRWVHEPFEQAFLQRVMESVEDAVLLDVGASYGMYTVMATQPQLRKNVGKVIAVEANSRVFSFLTRTVAKSEAGQNISLLNIAATESDIDGISFRRHPEFSEWSGIVHGNAPDDCDTVPGRCLAGVLAEQGWVPDRNLILKMDIEGGEPGAIAGLRSTLESANSYVAVIEFHVPLLEQSANGAMAFARQLLSLGADAVFELSEASKALIPLNSEDDIQKLTDRCRSGKELWQIMTNLVVVKNTPRSITDWKQ